MAPPAIKVPSTASSSDDSAPPSPVIVPKSPVTGSTRQPPLSPPRAIFMTGTGRSDEEAQADSAPTTPGLHPNPFGTPGATPGDQTPTFSASSRVQSSASGFGYFPGDITTRASGILSVHASTNEFGGFAHTRNASAISTNGGQNPFSSGRSNISGLSSNDGISEVGRPGLPTRASSAIREAFQSPPLRPMTIHGTSRTGSTVQVNARAPAKRMKSTMLTGEIEKPWTQKKNTVGR